MKALTVEKYEQIQCNPKIKPSNCFWLSVNVPVTVYYITFCYNAIDVSVN